jgi:hypothetical protein
MERLMAFCEEKNRLMLAHSEAVNHYVSLVARRHDGFATLSERERTSLAEQIDVVRGEIDDHRDALDAHASKHGCATAA